jgi:hypothetical protein
MSHNYDPAKQPCDDMYHNPECCMICGPAGSTIQVNQNEKGIMEKNIFSVIAMHQQAELGSNHDSYKQGIYTTNSVGDND